MNRPGFQFALLLASGWIAGCSTSDADSRPIEPARDGVTTVTHQESTSVREAHVQDVKQIHTIPPAIYEEMVAQEQSLQQHGLSSYRPIYVRGHYSAAYVEPDTNRIAWRGMTCTHSDCTGEGHEGGPFVFPDVYSGLRVSAEGELVGQIPPKDLRCPACNRSDAIERYSPPAAVKRRSELLAQLAEIRAARDEARKSGQPLPALATTPREIQDEIANLPVLYLVED